MQNRAAEPVQPRDLECVAFAQKAQQVVELRAAGLRAAGAVEMYVLASDAGAS